jgi:hypothetical protein
LRVIKQRLLNPSVFTRSPGIHESKKESLAV